MYVLIRWIDLTDISYKYITTTNKCVLGIYANPDDIDIDYLKKEEIKIKAENGENLNCIYYSFRRMKCKILFYDSIEHLSFSITIYKFLVRKLNSDLANMMYDIFHEILCR